MQLTLTAEWTPFSEGDDDEFIKVAGLIGYAYDRGDTWVWEVRRDDFLKESLGEGWVATKAEAKDDAEARIRGASTNE